MLYGEIPHNHPISSPTLHGGHSHLRRHRQIGYIPNIMNIPQSTITPFEPLCIPALGFEDINFDKHELWNKMHNEYRQMFNWYRGKTYDYMWEKAARACGAEWARAYENATPKDEMILNVKMPNVRCTQVFTFHPQEDNPLARHMEVS